MEIPNEKVGPGRILRGSRRTAARLKSNPKAKVLHPKFKAQHDALKARQLALNDADDLAIDASALVDECDFNARLALTDCQMDLVSLVRRDYQSPLYLSFFPKGFAEAKAALGADMHALLGTILVELGKQPKDSKLAVHSKPIKAAQDAYTVPLAEEKKALAFKDAAAKDLAIERGKWIAAYDALAGELRALFPRQKPLVDSFFVKFSTARAKAKDGQGPK